MDVQKYIASGTLELYVAGLLSEKENEEIHRYADVYPEIRKEIEAIEAVVLQLTKSTSPGMPNTAFDAIRSHTNDDVVPLNTKTPVFSYLGWAASLLFAAGMLWMYLENGKLNTEVKVVEQERQTLKEQLDGLEETLANNEETKRLLNALRSKEIEVVALDGQNVAPTTYAKVYWNKKEQKVYVDAQGLPEPPEGYDYQVWSLTLEPLAPTSIGVLSNFEVNSTRVFELQNDNTSEAFGITLEPEGGSETPNLEQLYTLGTVGP